MMELIIGVAIGLIASIIVFYFLRKSSFKTDEISNSIEMRLREMMPAVLRESNSMLVEMADQKLGAEKKEIRTDVENKRAEIERLIKVIQEDLRYSRDNLDKAEKDRIGSFNALKTELEAHKKITDQLAVSTENLKKVLSNNQLRGQFGEQVAEDLLKMAGFVKGVNYEYNKSQESVDSRPDFTILLPDGTKINVDAKFPYANLQKLMESESKESRDKFLNDFERDIKEKIKQVTTRDYINPDEKTVDFVILFIPNEMIFSFIYDKMNDVWSEAISKKVILAGPFSFTAILRLVKQAYENFVYQSNIREIIGHIKAFEIEFFKWNDSFNKLGERIDSLHKQYNEISTTRTNQLERRIEKITIQDDDPSKDLQQTLIPTETSTN